MVIQAIVSRALNSVTTEPKHAMTVVSQHSLASARGVYISPLFAESGEIVRRTSPKLSQSRNSQRFYFLLPLKTPGNIDCVEDEAQRRSTRSEASISVYFTFYCFDILGTFQNMQGTGKFISVVLKICERLAGNKRANAPDSDRYWLPSVRLESLSYSYTETQLLPPIFGIE
ncbi:hypothetical protein WN48_07395 [Eufriesea mexicana]|uniref:Uncharacterized protein n=1 Tax=Eufriesea mexicana TaxID=516756 RepID=A0A310SH80_9HYME|nr:hypothetical protein WN48_07395 [Eufriesea mexicana]